MTTFEIFLLQGVPMVERGENKNHVNDLIQKLSTAFAREVNIHPHLIKEDPTFTSNQNIDPTKKQLIEQEIQEREKSAKKKAEKAVREQKEKEKKEKEQQERGKLKEKKIQKEKERVEKEREDKKQQQLVVVVMMMVAVVGVFWFVRRRS